MLVLVPISDIIYAVFPLFGNGTNIQMVTVLLALYNDQADSTHLAPKVHLIIVIGTIFHKARLTQDVIIACKKKSY